MSESWDEGPVADLRARILDLEVECDIRGRERDRAVAAMRLLRAALKDVDIAHQPYAWVLGVQGPIAATAEWAT